MVEQSLSCPDANFVLSYLLLAFSPFVLCVVPPGLVGGRKALAVGFFTLVAGRFWDLVIRFERGVGAGAGLGFRVWKFNPLFRKMARSANAPFFDGNGESFVNYAQEAEIWLQVANSSSAKRASALILNMDAGT